MANEGFAALYKGLSAVTAGIIPKMAVRFSSFEHYKVEFGSILSTLQNSHGANDDRVC